MLYKPERIQKIKELMAEMQQVNVSALSSMMGVSEATIRNDLEQLEQEGFLTRFHGGATINKRTASEGALFSAESGISYRQSKEQIGIIAASLIQDREGVFLGPGTTTYFIALALRKRTDIYANIVTNNFYVAQALRGCSNFWVQFIGGRAHEEGFYTIPEDLHRDLNNLFLDKLFFSIDAIDISYGYTLSDPPAHDTIANAAEHSKQIIMVADYSKFGKRSFIKVGDLTFAKTVVTNAEIPAVYRNYYEAAGIQVVTPDDMP